MVSGKAQSHPFDVLIIGGGIAGLSVALNLPEQKRVALFTKGQLGESNTRYAQGGLAVALGEDDSPELHFQDTIAAGAGLCDEEAVRVLVEHGPDAARWLMQIGVHFDRASAESDTHATADGFLLGREGAHSCWRVLHAGGDATGAEIERALLKTLRTRSSIVVYEETFVRQLLVEDGSCVGVEAMSQSGETFLVKAPTTVLANGGAGSLWLHTSNPSGATADGLALAWQAGAALTDLEFMQFHPTVLVLDGTSHLISEAVRGEGAYLRNHAGERFMSRYSDQAELAPRDVVARAMLHEMTKEQTEYHYLDLRHLPAQKMRERFPTISAFCREHGLDLATDLLPVAPAAHYCMGGVMVDTYGRTTVANLFAVGEVACTGVHGANRLASNSLLEGLVYGIRVAEYLSDEQAQPYSVIQGRKNVSFSTPGVSSSFLSSSGSEHEQTYQQLCRELRQLMWHSVSLCRDEQGLLAAHSRIQALRSSLRAYTSPVQGQHTFALQETENLFQVAELVVLAALKRCESRGSHWRLDHQYTDESLAGHHYAFQRVNTYPYSVSIQATQHEEVASHV